jgi:hypothetical protein
VCGQRDIEPGGIVGAGGNAGAARPEYQHGHSSRLEEPAGTVSGTRRVAQTAICISVKTDPHRLPDELEMQISSGVDGVAQPGR